MQSVLSRRIAPLSSKRNDIPEVVTAVIQKMTQKNIEERYKSASGLKYDLSRIQSMLSDCDLEGLDYFKIATKDVSSFFTVPTKLIGRDKERNIISDVLDKHLRRRRQPSSLRKGLSSLSSHSSISDQKMEALQVEDGVSDSASSRGSGSRGGSGTEGMLFETGLGRRLSKRSSDSPDYVLEESSGSKAPLQARVWNEVRSSVQSTEGSLNRSGSGRSNTQDLPTSLLRQAHRLGQKERCEVITVCGAAGLGKSSLVHNISYLARSRGYFASAKFDQAKRAPFDPILKLLSSLFRQIFSENDVNTEFHNTIRAIVGPVWSHLYTYLDLPATLFSSLPASKHLTSHRHSLHLPSLRRNSSPLVQCGGVGNTASDWLRSGGSTKSSKFLATFLDVLGFLAMQQFLVLCVDDLQFADPESLELIQNIVSHKLPLVLILTYREEDRLPVSMRSLLASSTKIELAPFTEDDTAELVAETLCQDRDFVSPLVAVIQEKTDGNPFFVKEMLDVCYRTGCVYYSWKDSNWHYSLDKIFAEFQSQTYGSQINNDFVTKRLQALPYQTRVLLSWASLIGNTFSYSLVKSLLHNEISLSRTGKSIRNFLAQKANVKNTELPKSKSSLEPVSGLQGALSACVIVQGDSEDRFRFAHDRYMQAATTLSECQNKAEMHFAIAQAMIEQDFQIDATTSNKSLYVRSRHICLAVDLLKKRVVERARYRDLLYQAAENACESSARSTGLYYFTHCLTLLQDNPWDETHLDVRYEETLALFTRAAECYWYQGFFEAALGLLQTIFSEAKDAVDKAPAWIIQSRVFAVRGDSFAAFHALKQCMADLGFDLPDRSWEECDAEYHEISEALQKTDLDELCRRPPTDDRVLLTAGAVLVEILSAAFWSNSLLFYELTLLMVKVNLYKGTFPQAGMGYLHLSSIAIGRFGMCERGISIADIAKILFDRFRDHNYTIGRGETLHALFVGHLETHMAEQIPFLHRGNQATVVAGDRIMTLLNIGVSAAFRLWSSYDVSEVENFVLEAPFEHKNWQYDLRGGVFLISVRQYCRALQGKTRINSPEDILSDDEHHSATYLEFVDTKSSNPKRPRTVYLSFKLTILVRYEHFEEAIVTGEKLLPMMESMLSMPFYFSTLFYLSLALIAQSRRQNEDDTEATLSRVKAYKDKLISSTKHNDINYRVWISLLTAEMADISNDHAGALSSYEAALDTAESNNFIMDEALAYELYAASLVRRGANRLANRLLKECVSSYRRVGAVGKSEHVQEKYKWILETTGPTVREIACQTDIIDTGNSAYKLEQNEAHARTTLGGETPADRMQAWLAPNGHVSSMKTLDLQSAIAADGLDMIDLASILESSQVLSSELQVDRLLSKMTEIILESTAANLSAIVIEDDQVEWSVAAVATPDGVTAFPSGQSLETVDDTVARQTTLYALRFKEVSSASATYGL